MKQGKFIVFEGLDGSGISSHSALLRKFLRENGVDAYLTKEPTDNVIGGLIRGALSGVYSLPPDCLQLLFAADRRHHLEREIYPVLRNGGTVVCDRYLWSSVAYGSLYLDKSWLLEINKDVVLPDLTLLLKVSPKTSYERMKRDRFDLELYEEISKLKKAWETYEWLAKKFKQSFVVIDSEGDREEVRQKIIKTVLEHPRTRMAIKRTK